MSSLILRNASVAGGAIRDVGIVDGLIAEVAPVGAPADGADELELDGYVLLPSAAEPHAHLDKAFTADVVAAEDVEDLTAAIAAWHAYRRTLSVDDIAARARRAALVGLARGATAVRTHVDVGEGIGLRAAEALVHVRDELRDLVEIQVVALSYPLSPGLGDENRELVREALELGVDVVGGAPHIDNDPLAHIEFCLGIAREFERPVDLHTDEHLGTSVDLADIARLAQGFPHGITASHCVSLGMQPAQMQTEVSAAVAAADVAVITLPLTNLYLQARNRTTATPRGLTAVRALREAGATVAGGGDNVQDPFNPLGNADPLQTAQLLVAAAHVDWRDAYGLVSEGARAAMALAPVRVEAGFPADLLAIAGSSLREAIATASEDRLIFRAGRLVARTRVEREFFS